MIFLTNFHGVNFQIKSNKFYINGEVAGYYFALSTSHILKSMSFPLVQNIYFDEFILDKGTYHYLTKEINCFLNFYDTISRDRDVKVFFIANAITMTNPYFLYFDIQLPNNHKEFKLFKDNLIVLQYVPSTQFIEQRSKTRFGKLIQNTEYGDFSLTNKFILDNTNFIDKKSGNCKFVFAFKYESQIYGVWKSQNNDFMYVSYDYNKNDIVFATTSNDHSENTVFLKKLSDTNLWRDFINYYKYGLMRFESVNIKNQSLNLIKSLVL